MARKRKHVYSRGFRNINDDPRFYVDRHDIVRLTKMAKSWEFTCSFCFKKFPSAQAMGGHQNAHRHERMEERRLYIRDPIGYRKRAYLKALKESGEQSPTTVDWGSPNPSSYLHGAKQVVKYGFVNINGQTKILQRPLVEFVEFNDVGDAHGNSDSNKDNKNIFFEKTVMNFLPLKELSLAESVGVRGEDGKCNADMEFDVDLDQKLDLTLKL